MKSINEFRILIVLCSFLFIGGIVGIGFMARGLYLINKIKGWPRTNGIITNSAISEEPVRFQDSGSKQPMYKPVIYYEYTVDNRKYVNNTITVFKIETGYGDRNRVEKILKDYPPGKLVSIAYDTNDPGTAILSTKYLDMVWFWFFVFCILTLIAVIAIAILIVNYNKGNMSIMHSKIFYILRIKR
jgi:hypothetical protein